MNRLIKYAVVFIIGLFVGGLSIYKYLYTLKETPLKTKIRYEDVLAFSDIVITKNNCEGERIVTVGAVLGNILENNQNSKINRTSLSCLEEHCWVGISYCNPWESSECGSRILRFEVNSEDKILESTFQCVDIP